MEWRDFFDGLAKEAARDFTTWGWHGDPALHPLTAQKYAWEWQGNTFHIQSKPDNRFYMEFTLPASGYMTVTMAGYCKLVSYKIQVHADYESVEFLQGSIIAATKILWRVGSETKAEKLKGARELWNYFNDTFKPKTPWLQPDE